MSQNDYGMVYDPFGGVYERAMKNMKKELDDEAEKKHQKEQTYSVIRNALIATLFVAVIPIIRDRFKH